MTLVKHKAGLYLANVRVAVKFQSKQERGREAGATAPEVKFASGTSIPKVFWRASWSLLMISLCVMPSWQLHEEQRLEY